MQRDWLVPLQCFIWGRVGRVGRLVAAPGRDHAAPNRMLTGPPVTPLHRNACTADMEDYSSPCCHEGLKLGSERCDGLVECRWAAGTCSEDAACVLCQSCLDRLEDGFGMATTAQQDGRSGPLELLMQDEMHQACVSLNSTRCDEIDWAAWYTGTVRLRIYWTPARDVHPLPKTTVRLCK